MLRISFSSLWKVDFNPSHILLHNSMFCFVCVCVCVCVCVFVFCFALLNKQKKMARGFSVRSTCDQDALGGKLLYIFIFYLWTLSAWLYLFTYLFQSFWSPGWLQTIVDSDHSKISEMAFFSTKKQSCFLLFQFKLT